MTQVNFWIFLVSLCFSWTAVSAPDRYSLWSGAVTGSGARTVGMAGAVTALPDDYFGALENPAGIGLTLTGLSLTIANAGIEDEQQTDPGVRASYYTSGLALPLGDWGASLGQSTNFHSIAPDGEKIERSEYWISIAKQLISNRFSAGVGVAPTKLKSPTEELSSWRFTLGTLMRFQNRVFAGLSYTPAFSFGPDQRGRTFSHPHVVSVGGAWIPNRFFRGGLSIKGISPEADSFRFHVPSERLGEGWAVQYHAGVDYRFLCLKNLHSLIFSGIYFDHSRSAQNSRVHLTWGLEFNPWFVRFSAGIDMAPGYRNVAFGVGVDIADILRMLKVFPPEVQAPAGGAFPSPLEISDDWLPTQLQDNPDEAFQTIGPDLEDIPKTLEKIPEALK